MSARSLRVRRIAIAAILLVAARVSFAQTAPACPTEGIGYSVSFAHVADHHLKVAVLVNSAGQFDLQLPVWNALYQVRDFSQNVYNVAVSSRGASSSQDAAKVRVPRVRKLDKSTWRVENAQGCTVFQFSYRAESAGPFGIAATSEHAFINWAMLLPYRVGAREQKVEVALREVPAGWSIRDGSGFCKEQLCVGASYDELVDSPLEMGKFALRTFQQGGATYNVVVHADVADYDLDAIASTLSKITAATVDWMEERPCPEFTFIYHFLRGPAGGGMEHRCSTAIDVTADRIKSDPLTYAPVSAHEFFHVWNVKRIRPRSLEPIDFTQEQYTRALWFSEGVTNTVGEYMLARGGVIDETTFLHRLATQIEELEARPAKRFQSVEESSLDTWFDKYSYYRTADRSISYYNKGQIVGVLLDLQMRELTNGKRSLRDLFHYMNERWANRGEFFDDSESVRLAAQVLTGDDFRQFFRDYISGTVALPYDLFGTVGLRLTNRQIQAGNIGFTTSRNLGSPPVIVRVEEGSEAEENGLAPGDVVLKVNGSAALGDINTLLRNSKPGDRVMIYVRTPEGERELMLQLTARRTARWVFEELEHVTAEQKARRSAWIVGSNSGDEGYSQTFADWAETHGHSGGMH